MKRHSAKLKLNITSLLNEGVSNLLWKTKQMRKGKMTCEKRVRHTQLVSYWQLPFLDRTFGSTFNCESSFNSSSLWIWFKKFLIQFWPFSFGPGTSPTASTRFVHKFKGRKLFVSPSAGFHPHANASETTVAYGTNVDNISREALSAGHDGANHPSFPYW